MVEHADEVVDVVGTVAARIQSLGQGEERLGVVGEVVDVENGLRVRDVVLLQVGVETCSWSPGTNMELSLRHVMKEIQSQNKKQDFKKNSTAETTLTRCEVINRKQEIRTGSLGCRWVC